MDIYGYTAFPYNQSDELSKQMFAQQALANPGPYREIPEGHNMPAPTGTPWNVTSLPWSMQSPPNLVQFTAQTPTEMKVSAVVHCKRKSLDVEPVIPPKQLITEEKMAAHLSSLHISANYTQHSLSSEDVMEVGIDTSALCEKLKGHTIVLSEDVKKVQEESLLPTALIERLQKPQMSLVVWKPRDNVLDKIKEENDQLNSDEETPKKRNGVLVPEQSRMEMEM
ncbi:jg24295 [Pararge aegeria aegeria]|uniref:Jg24295 protein n=2 Tax=Pararge aegeria TaxID=116150 RepID=A0A8S4SF33_9NEOP|nr:jg24295 [Pararge aegeria aegeria]